MINLLYRRSSLSTTTYFGHRTHVKFIVDDFGYRMQYRDIFFLWIHVECATL